VLVLTCRNKPSNDSRSLILRAGTGLCLLKVNRLFSCKFTLVCHTMEHIFLQTHKNIFQFKIFMYFFLCHGIVYNLNGIRLLFSDHYMINRHHLLTASPAMTHISMFHGPPKCPSSSACFGGSPTLHVGNVALVAAGSLCLCHKGDTQDDRTQALGYTSHWPEQVSGCLAFIECSTGVGPEFKCFSSLPCYVRVSMQINHSSPGE
jgi:hypothetical protein